MAKLTVTERQIAAALCGDCTSIDAIAARMGLSKKWVSQCLREIRRVMGVKRMPLADLRELLRGREW
jgi:bacterioferritin-associated ferredoxin